MYILNILVNAVAIFMIFTGGVGYEKGGWQKEAGLTMAVLGAIILALH